MPVTEYIVFPQYMHIRFADHVLNCLRGFPQNVLFAFGPRAAVATSQAVYRPVSCSHVSVNQTGAVSKNRRSNWKARIQSDRSASSLELVAQNDLISLDLQH